MPNEWIKPDISEGFIKKFLYLCSYSKDNLKMISSTVGRFAFAVFQKLLEA